jgi:tRNA threonylcarbamoyladenosine modification (KEOPS) complex Cgi121 subunit
MPEGLISPSIEDLNAWQLEVTPGTAKSVMQGLLDTAEDAKAEVLIVDGRFVFGLEHLSTAVFHAHKAIVEGRNSSKSLAMESLLYASGERQLNAAIKKMGVNDSTSSIVVVHLGGGPLSLSGDWAPLSENLVPDKERLAQYGITEAELQTVDPGRLSDLVLERVASVDVIKK